MSSIPRIRRGRPNASFTAISNKLICDQSLSPEARLVLIYLLSKFENWELQINDIRNLLGKNGKPCGRNKTYEVIKELKDARYIVDCQDIESGRFAGVTYYVFDEPHEDPDFVRTAHNREAAQEHQSIPSPNNRDTVPRPKKQDPENRDHIKDRELEKTESERARACELEDKKAVNRAFWRLVKDWPGFAGMPKETARNAWLKLEPAERAEAAEKRDRWLALLRSQKKTHTPSPTTYFTEKLWRAVPDQPERITLAVIQVAAFGKLWSAERLARLLAGPEITEYTLTAFERQAIKRGELDKSNVLRGKQAIYGWPTVNAMDLAAESRKPLTLAAKRIELISDAPMEAVQVGSQLWDAWKKEHERRGWPWLPSTGGQAAMWMPSGGPDGLKEFQAVLTAGSVGNQGCVRAPEAAA